MRTRIITFILAALPMALTAHANEISMDVGGMPSGSGSSTSSSDTRGDCATARSLQADERETVNSSSHSGQAPAGSANTRMQVSDEVVDEPVTDTTSGSSATGKSLAVPVKSRSTRWQSLVPGAIK